MTPADRTALQALQAPSVADLTPQLAYIGAGIADSLSLLSFGLTPGLLDQAQAQARGLEQHLSRLREALHREAGGGQ